MNEPAKPDELNEAFDEPLVRYDQWGQSTKPDSRTDRCCRIRDPERLVGRTRCRCCAIPPSTSSLGWRETGRMYRGAPISNGSPASSSRRGGASRPGGRVMDRRGRTVFPGLLYFLVVAVCASFAGVLSVGALETATTAPAKLADGIWIVQARAIPGTGHCGDRLVRLTNRQGRLSGAVALARASVPIENFALLPDGSFSGTTRGGLAGSRLARAYKITGKFSGDTVSLTLETDACPPRHGVAIRQAGDG